MDPPARGDDDTNAIAMVMGGHMDRELLYVSQSDSIQGAKKDIKLPPDSSFVLVPCPKKDKREIYYVAGASGSGKSFQARGIAERYKKLFPDREIYLISKLTEDETLDTMKTGKPSRINVETLLSNPIDNIDVFENSLVIFDDYDLNDIKVFIHNKINQKEIVEYTDNNIIPNDLHFIYKYLYKN